MRLFLYGLLAAGVGIFSGCALRPSGEDEERDRASKEGKAYEEKSEPPALSEKAGPDEYLAHANRDRPEHLEAILAPSIVPAD